MIVVTNNKCEDFYNTMGKFFGSRIVQNETNDRIYDDNNKKWYIYFDEETAVAFVSIADNVIKNIYGIKEEYIIELLQYVKEQFVIQDSIVTKAYIKAYEQSGLIVDSSSEYKNFIVVRSKTDEQ